MSLDKVEEQRVHDSRVYSFSCAHCDDKFPSQKALQSHLRAKHKVRTSFDSFLPASGVCLVRRLQFSSRPRLLAHVGDARQRGKKSVKCKDVLKAGLVAPLPDEELQAARAADTLLRQRAHKRGLTQPKSEFPAKRRSVVSVVPSIECKRGFLYVESEFVEAPGNALRWEDVRPLKRLCAKTALDAVLELSNGV